jgi:hypothetical protein
MTDLVCAAVTAGFVLLTVGFLVLCDRLQGDRR